MLNEQWNSFRLTFLYFYFYILCIYIYMHCPCFKTWSLAPEKDRMNQISWQRNYGMVYEGSGNWTHITWRRILDSKPLSNLSSLIQSAFKVNYNVFSSMKLLIVRPVSPHRILITFTSETKLSTAKCHTHLEKRNEEWGS